MKYYRIKNKNLMRYVMIMSRLRRIQKNNKLLIKS